MRTAQAILLILLIQFVSTASALALDRVALVIGNNGYGAMRPLENAHNDARLIHHTLTAMGFDAGAEPLLDLDLAEFSQALGEFAGRARQADTAVLYYAGHGMVIDGVNYLIPVDATLEDDWRAEWEAIPLDRVLKVMGGASRLALALVDACRNDPYGNARKFRGNSSPGFRGLTRPPSLSKVAVGFATQFGRLASDGEGGNSPFARSLARRLPSPGMGFEDTLALVGLDVERETDGEQSPHLSARSALYGTPLVSALDTPGPDPEDLAEARELLAALGYEVGSQDEAEGDPTPSALIEFQRWAEIAETGEADAATLRALRLAARLAIRATNDDGPKGQPAAVTPVDRYPELSTFREPGCPDCPEMVVIPAGSFWMGSPEGEEGRFKNEDPQRRVTIGKFALSRTEVTFDQWQACADDGYCGSNRKPGDEGWGRGSRPVINVSWNDITGGRGFIAWMNSKVSGTPYRLPSEAEWEYAARAGTTGRFSNNGGEGELCGIANHADRSTRIAWRNKACSDGFGFQTAPVGSFSANAFGLHDMHGNVNE